MTKKKARPRFRLPGLEYDAPSGVARLEVCLPGTGGARRRRRTVAAPDYDDAVEAWRKFRREVGLRGGKAVVWTVATYIAEHRDALTARVKESTARNLNYRLDVLSRMLGGHRLDRVNAAVVRDFVAAADTEGLGVPTVNGLLATLRRILRDAVERQELAHYPIRGRLPIRKEEALRLELSDEERAAFLAAFDDEAGFRELIAGQRVERLEKGRTPKCFALPGGEAAGVLFSFFRTARPLFVVALETGLSRGDLLALRWKDVAQSPIRIPRAKTGNEAVIPISRVCAAALEELRARPVVHAERVFLGPEGKPLCVDTLNRYFRIAKKLSGLKRRLRFHDLRHTFGCRLVSAGVPLPIVAKAMGHSSVRMTERYARPSEASMRAVSVALDGESRSDELDREPSGQGKNEERH